MSKKLLRNLGLSRGGLKLKSRKYRKFLEDFGDIFLSLSYYRQCLDYIQPIVDNFLEWLDELCQSRLVKNDSSLMAICRTIHAILSGLMISLTGRFNNFDRSTADMWENISAVRFRKVESMIKGYHTTIGAVLCSLTIKMETWSRTFPHKKAGGPARRAEFIMSEMRPGIGRIQEIEDEAPMMSEYA